MVICAFCEKIPNDQAYGLWVCDHCPHTLAHYLWKRFGDVLLKALDDFENMDFGEDPSGCHFYGKKVAEALRTQEFPALDPYVAVARGHFISPMNWKSLSSHRHHAWTRRLYFTPGRETSTLADKLITVGERHSKNQVSATWN